MRRIAGDRRARGIAAGYSDGGASATARRENRYRAAAGWIITALHWGGEFIMGLMRSACVLAAILSLAACSLISGPPPESPNPRYNPDALAERNGSLLGGDGGFNLFGGDKSAPQQQSGIGVNSFLWRATLDTLSFMPLASADPFGGVIITDWYSPPATPDERFKVNIFILGRQLRADGVRAAVFRQGRTPDGGWVDQAVDKSTQTDLENAILTRARQLRVSTTALAQ